MNLYSTHASEFSATRQSPWAGWERVLKNFREREGGISEFSVLDVGCGNGRFLDYLVSQEMPPAKYVGIDNSEFLLNVAKSTALRLGIKSEFMNRDLNEDGAATLSMIGLDGHKFDLIVIFGVLHHMQNKDTIARILSACEGLLAPSGILALTFWDFMNSEKEKRKIIRTLDAENNNHLMSFGSKGAERFVHFSDETERSDLISSLNLITKDRFLADGASSKLNDYVILSK